MCVSTPSIAPITFSSTVWRICSNEKPCISSCSFPYYLGVGNPPRSLWTSFLSTIGLLTKHKLLHSWAVRWFILLLRYARYNVGQERAAQRARAASVERADMGGNCLLSNQGNNTLYLARVLWPDLFISISLQGA